MILFQVLDFDDVTVASQDEDRVAMKFEHTLKREYSLEEDDCLFDMATGKYLHHTTVVAAHIYQYRWRKFFKWFSSLRNVDDPHNGLLLCRPVQWAFERAKLYINVNN